MPHLLDTQLLYQMVFEPEKLSHKAIKLLSGNLVGYSIVSLWELAIKQSVGKLDMPDNAVAMISSSNAPMVPVEVKHIIQYQQLPLMAKHRDPFDRLLIAQAMAEDYVMVSTDKQFGQYPIRLEHVS